MQNFLYNFSRYMRFYLNKCFFLLLCILTCSCFYEDTESSPDFLPLDDSKYPYADIPRIVIEVDGFKDIRDVHTEHDALLQVYGKDAPETGVLKLKIRGRGNSSFKMPKYGMKLEFLEKTSLLGMDDNKDWALIANFGDKTFIRNVLAFKLSKWLHAKYTPDCRFAELYLNRKYMGLYLVTENVKVGKNRVNIPKTDDSFLLEKEDSKKLDPPYIVTHSKMKIHVKHPKELTPESEKLVVDYLNSFENYISGNDFYGLNRMENWLDISDFAIFYWVQEFSKNEDGNFARSIFFTWQKGGVIHFGPVWDFDLGFGNASRVQNQNPEDWYIRNYLWNRQIFKDTLVVNEIKKFWKENRETFKSLIDSIPVYIEPIRKAVDNEYKRWPVLTNTENWALKAPYDSYEEAVAAMVLWMTERYKWIDSNI